MRLRDCGLAAAFHGQQLRLYGNHAPHQLMAFLKGSPHYPLDLALDCALSVAPVLRLGIVIVLGHVRFTCDVTSIKVRC